MSAPDTTPQANCRYGAPMGRHSVSDLDTSGKLYLSRVHLNSGGYDAGGAYWGHGQPLWAVSDETDTIYLRAASREDAKRKIRESILAHHDAEHIRFFR